MLVNTKRYFSIFVLVTSLFSGSSIVVAAEQCSQQEGFAAETVVDYIESWDGLYRAYKEFGKCDDGGVAEGLSDDTGRLFVNQWNTLPHLEKLVGNDPGFKKFVLKHLDETLPADELHSIKSLTESNCPDGMQEFCAEIGKAAVGS